MKKRPKAINLQRELREQEEWLPRNAARIRDGALAKIEEAFANPGEQRKLLIAAGRFHDLWGWYASEGGVAAQRGDANGWATMSRALGYGIGYVALFVRAFETGANKNPVVLANSVALMLAHAIAIGDDRAADWLAARMEASITTRVFGRWIDLNAFEPFILQLHARGAGRTIDFGATPPDFGPYQRLWDAWTADVASLQAALHEACEHHLASVNDTNAWTAEFAPSIYRVWAAELLAVARTRARLGATTPPVEHPLMQTTLAKPPAVVPPALLDDVAQGLVDRARAAWGDVSLPQR